MHRLLLVRHAQGSLGSDDYDRLSPTGFEQARFLGQRIGRLGERMQIVRGGLRRHRETAEAFGLESDVDVDLDEYRVDHLLQAAYADSSRLGLSPPPREALADPKGYLATFLALFPDVLCAWQEQRLSCAVNGSWAAFHDRVASAGRRLVKLFDEAEPAAPVIAVTSAGVISTLSASLLGRDLAWQRSLNVALYNASVTELTLDADGSWRDARINCIEHLQSDSLITLA